ncbi:hypothetical protein PR048_010780 [Dryococelus australis]|uniref:Uncharacterized protein n=1 Tax=Dryococelus australis TaxID=614101 RepID=A0ABQ9I4V2_9NEOP|nr:hypothetical protein PR048_010780 [Dryococelus australis]
MLNLFKPHKIATLGESSSSVYVDIHHEKIFEVEILSTTISDFQDKNGVPLETNSDPRILTQSDTRLLYDISVNKNNVNNCSGRNDHVYEYVDDFDQDPTHQPDESLETKSSPLLMDLAPEEIDEPIDDAVVDIAVIVQLLKMVNRGTYLNISSADEKVKRRKGVRKREEDEKKKKEKGLSYINRNCNCANQTIKRNEFSEFINNSNQVKDEVLCSRMYISDKSVEKKGRGKIQGKYHDRQITVEYSLCVDTIRTNVCKEMFMHVHGVSRRKGDVLVQKLCAFTSDFVEPDTRGRHIPKNKLLNERIEIRDFTDKYPRHESHYSRRDSLKKYLFPKKKIKTSVLGMFSENCSIQPGTSSRNLTSTPAKNMMNLKHERGMLQINKSLHDSHIAEGEKAYESKKEDKFSAKGNPAERVVKTYSDTCGGTISSGDQKFLLPGHTRLECDSDQARIERAKKQIDEQMKIMVPQD